MPLLPQPRPRDLAALLNGLADGAGAGELTDIRAHEAMGWEVRGRLHGSPLVRNPVLGAWQPMPRVSRSVDAAAAFRPWGWRWRAGEREDGSGFGWVSAPGPAEPGLLVRYAEANAATPALALLRAALSAQLLLVAEARPPAATRCLCGWDGPDAALLPGGGCPDCRRRLPALEHAA
jgi:hypothetical protein